MVIRSGNGIRKQYSDEIKISGQISNARPDCPDCGTRGVMGLNARVTPDGRIKLTCPRDGKQWVTVSGTCNCCNEPNGFPSDGLCSKCYGLTRGGGEENVRTAKRN